MKSTSRDDRSDRRPESSSSGGAEIKKKALYTKPAVQPAGSVFNRTKALGIGAKGGLTASFSL